MERGTRSPSMQPLLCVVVDQLLSRVWLSATPWPAARQLSLSFPSRSFFRSPPDTSTAECRFRFGSAASFFLELLAVAFCSSQAAYWTPLTWRAHLPVSFHFASSCRSCVLTARIPGGSPVPPPVDLITPHHHGVVGPARTLPTGNQLSAIHR